MKIYNSRYSKLIKLLDFFTVNILVFTYLKYFYTDPTTASALLGIIFSLVFIRINEYFHLYTGKLKGRYLTKSLALIFREGANKQVISSQADSLIKISRIWADFFPANTSNQPI